MFDAVCRLRQHFEQKRVVGVGKLAEYGHCRFDDILYVGSDLCRAHRDIRFAEYQMMARATRGEFQHLEIAADKGWSIDENVVIGGVKTISFLLEAGIDVPSRRCFVRQRAWHMLLPDNIHE